MNRRATAAARLPPAGLTGLESRWSRLLAAPSADGSERTWHLLDTWAQEPADRQADLTLLCVHGNPTWSYLWRELLREVERFDATRIRVIAIDQLDMGFSERSGIRRTLATRIDDLCRLTDTLALQGPVITVAHDWGGPISLGWALRHLPQAHTAAHSDAGQSAGRATLAGIVLTNTAVHQPAGSPAPAVIRLAQSRLLLRPVTVYTAAFIEGALAMSRPRLQAGIRAGFHAPYRERSRRAAIADFVADIPLDPDHESAATLDAIAAGTAALQDTPALLLWGPRDRVFSDLYLDDLQARLPHADVHRFPQAAHLVTEDADVAGAVVAWLQRFPAGTGRPDNGSAGTDLPAAALAHPDPPDTRTAAAAMTGTAPAVAGLSGSRAIVADDRAMLGDTPCTERRALADFSLADAAATAVVEPAPAERTISFGELTRQTADLAAGMQAFGIRPGDRVAVMITPGIDLVRCVYACWRLGATLVLVDAGLGRAGMQAALRSARPSWLIGITRALVAARVLRWPGRRIAVRAGSRGQARLLGCVSDLDSLAALGQDRPAVPSPSPDAIAAVVFTSGSTGPSKGVIYRHRQLEAQRDELMSLYGITTQDRLVAAFAPFALYGPTMGITSIVPAMDVAAPGSLTAQSLLDAVQRIDATLVFASPAALSNVMNDRRALDDLRHRGLQPVCAGVRLVLSAGAPVRASLLQASAALFTQAAFHTPYGMTEVLPVADISLTELTGLAASADDRRGVCVGYPVAGIEVRIDPLDTQGRPTAAEATDRLGEIVIRAAHARDSYDRLWLTHWRASQPPGWHRTGDIGQMDTQGRLWVGGRLAHVITTPAGPLAPVSSEQRLEQLDTVSMAAVVGIGPVGTQAVVAVVQAAPGTHPSGAATLSLLASIRQALADQTDVAAAFVVDRLPVDRRHNSKIDRTAVAAWAARALAGERAGRL